MYVAGGGGGGGTPISKLMYINIYINVSMQIDETICQLSINILKKYSYIFRIFI